LSGLKTSIEFKNAWRHFGDIPGTKLERVTAIVVNVGAESAVPTSRVHGMNSKRQKVTKMDANVLETKKLDTKLLVSTLASFWPLGITVMSYSGSPSTLFTNPIAQFSFAIAAVWLILGFFVMLKFNRIWQLLLAQVPFTLPVALAAILVPAIITIVSAIK
jgi:hypothetical protein